MKYDLIIIGGGAAGLCAAIKAAENNRSVLILEHSDRAGRKILMTGNGKCNLSNSFCKPDLLDKNPEGMFPFFTSGNRSFIKSVINSFCADDSVSFFEGLGLLTENKDGYIYPRCEQASAVNNILRKECERRNVSIITGFHVDSVCSIKDTADTGFVINNKYSGRKLLLAAGGMSAPKTGSDGSGYKICASLGHTVIDPIPALCGIKCSDRFFREISGVRNYSEIELLTEAREPVLKVRGNIQFTSYGISGIPVFQISSEAGRMLRSGARPVIRIDLLPEYDRDSITEYIDSFCTDDSYDLPSVLNHKLQNVIEKEIRNNDRHKDDSIGRRAACVIKRFRVNPVSLCSFDDAQTTCGGISTDEIDPGTMESRIVPGLYFAGEIIDVNGICGGYNLQWAWSTAHIAASHI